MRRVMVLTLPKMLTDGLLHAILGLELQVLVVELQRDVGQHQASVSGKKSARTFIGRML